MQIKNVTKNTVLATDATLLTSPFAKSKGLIASKEKTVIFYTRFGIHTFGVRFPIDVIILNKTNHVSALKQNLKPNHFFFWNPKYPTVIELPKDTVEETKTEIGDKLQFT